MTERNKIEDLDVQTASALKELNLQCQGPSQMPEDPFDLAHRLYDEGAQYERTYRETLAVADLNAAMLKYQHAIGLMPKHHPTRAAWLYVLGTGYRDRHRRGGLVDDLWKCIQVLQEALQYTPDIHPNREKILGNLSYAFQQKWLAHHLDEDLLEYQNALKELAACSTAADTQVFELGTEDEEVKFVKNNPKTRLEQLKEDLAAISEDHADRAGRLYSLGAQYQEQYQVSQDLGDLNTGIQILQESLDKTPEADLVDRPPRLYSLAMALKAKYQRTDTLEDLGAYISQLQAAVRIMPKDNPNWSNPFHQLGVAYSHKHQRTGSLDDLQEAIRQFQEGLDRAAKGHKDQKDLLFGLAAVYNDRYDRTGALDDLERAIQIRESLCNQTSEIYPEWAPNVLALGELYDTRHRRRNAPHDLDKAIQLVQNAVNATPTHNPDRPFRLQALGSVLLQRHRRSQSFEDLRTAIRLLKEALDLTATDDPSLGELSYHLGLAYHHQYYVTSEMTDLDTAVQFSKDSVNKMPEDHPARANYEYILGIILKDVHQRTEKSGHLYAARIQFENALNRSFSRPLPRFRAGKWLFHLQIEAHEWLSAYETASKAVNLVPLLLSRSLVNSDKQFLISEVGSLASDAAAVSLLAGKSPYDALSLLESARGIIVGSQSDMRVDLSDLELGHPKLAEEFTALSKQLSSVSAPELDPHSMSRHQGDQRFNASRKVEEIIETIRDQPGFSRFLLAPLENDLMVAANSGPIIVVTASRVRCDAIIIRANKITVLPLPDLQLNDIHDRTKALNSRSLDVDILEWLWETIAMPVLEELEYKTAPTGDEWPRLWWVPTGSLSKFPIHAAGYHSDGSSNTVLDRVISSYASSLKALMHNRRRQPKSTNLGGQNKALLVAMEELQYAPQEVDKVDGICKSMNMQVVKLYSCKTDDVLSALKNCSVFHFAGHGLSNSSDPSQSSLLLKDGRLTVESLFQLNLQSQPPLLAYLSACGTGRISNDGLLDEGVHLIGACVLAGFQNVIGTLWEVNDLSCVDVAINTYERIQANGMKAESIGEGLHHATRQLRGKWLVENEERTANRASEAHGQSDQFVPEHLSSSAKARTTRDIVSSEAFPMYWVPYVYYGV